jgi:hypothetical protein
MNGSRLDGRTSLFDFHYLVERPGTVEHLTETHRLGLFTSGEYRKAFESVGLEVEHDEEGLMGRGLSIGTKPPAGNALSPRVSRSGSIGALAGGWSRRPPS